MQLESMYQEIILDHYRAPHHKGLTEPFDAEVHHVNPVCGDEVTLRVTLKDVNGEPVVEDVSFESLGCSISQASGRGDEYQPGVPGAHAVQGRGRA